jgi:hypothetical protein
MGYNTDFKGSIKISAQSTLDQIKELKKFFGEDVRNHPDWVPPEMKNEYLTYINLEFSDDYEIQWDGSEKTYNMVEMINLIRWNMGKKFLGFSFSGSMLAQGEEIGDVWQLVFDENGTAVKKEIEMPGEIIECPECGHEWRK